LGGLVGLPQRAAYHGTKHAVLGMTKSAGVEYAPRGIRINAVCPGTIDTPMVADMLEGQAETMAEIMKQQSIGRLVATPAARQLKSFFKKGRVNEKRRHAIRTMAAALSDWSSLNLFLYQKTRMQGHRLQQDSQ
jgi:NAD(P)-dependent dehydrogenase (short-subunit alcohol dehydrogenase family)